MELPAEKLVIRLWETLAEKGIGSLLSPWQIGREGRARNEVRRDELLLLAQAETDADDIRAGRKHLQVDGKLLQLVAPESRQSDNPLEPTVRIEPTIDFGSLAQVAGRIAVSESARTEINASKAVIFAEEILAEDRQIPPDRKVDDDWLFSWREHAGKVSKEDLQRLWGSVLAGEVKSPGSYSVRTLDFLRSLSQDEANQISKLASFVVANRVVRSQYIYLTEHGVTLDLLLRMQELGVVSGVESSSMIITFKTQKLGKFQRALYSNTKVLIIEHEDASREVTLEVYPLTVVGTQLFRLGTFSSDVMYLTQVGKEIAAQGFAVWIADHRKVSETESASYNEIKIDA